MHFIHPSCSCHDAQSMHAMDIEFRHDIDKTYYNMTPTFNIDQIIKNHTLHCMYLSLYMFFKS